MLETVKYEIKELYRDSTIYGFWKDDKEISETIYVILQWAEALLTELIYWKSSQILM